MSAIVAAASIGSGALAGLGWVYATRSAPTKPAAPIAAVRAPSAPPPADASTTTRSVVRKTPCGPPYIMEHAYGPALGPRRLPRRGRLGRVFRSYVPLGGLPPKAFVRDYRATDNTWRMPLDHGFAHPGGYVNARPDIEVKKLPRGVDIDHFDGPHSAVLAPLGTPYEKRALPPDAVNDHPGGPPCNYAAYTVERPLPVRAGWSERAFGQPGGGRRYHVVCDRSLRATGCADGEDVSAADLVSAGYLRPIRPR